MPSKNIKGLIVEIGGDTTKLGKALYDVDKRSRDLSDELKKLDKALKLDPSNIGLIEEKQKALKEQVAATSEKLKLLREHEEQVKEAFERGDEVSTEKMEKLHREIVLTESALKNQAAALDQTTDQLSGLKDGSIAAAEAEEKMQAEAAEANKKLEEQKKKAADARKELGDYAEKGAKVAEKAAAGMAAAVVTATTALAALVLKEAENADELGDMSKKTGLSTEKLQEYKYVAAKLGTDLDTVTGAHTKLVKSMSAARKGSGETADAFKTLGVDVVGANGKLRDADEVFLETVDRLSKMEDGTERDSLAMQIFGRSAQELNPIIKAGSSGIAEYTQKAHELGVVVSDETVGALAEVQDGVKDVTFQFGAAKQELAAEFAPVAKEVLTALSDLIKRGKEQIKDPQVKKSIKDLGDSFAKLIKSGTELGVKALPTLVKALKFLVEHGKEAAFVLGAVWAALKAVSVITNAAKAISTVKSALEAMTAATKAAEVAQVSMNTTMGTASLAAGGWIAAIGLVVAALAALAIASAEADKKIIEDMTATSREISNSVEEILQSQRSARDAFEQTSDEMELSAAKAATLIARLEELESQGSLTAEEQREYNRLIHDLNEILPGLNLEIDEQTGLLKDGATALEEQVKQLKARAEFTAIEDLYTESLRNNIKLAIAKEKAEKNLTTALAKREKHLKTIHLLEGFKNTWNPNALFYGDYRQNESGYIKAKDDLRLYNAEVEAAQKALDLAAAAYDENDGELQVLTDRYDSAAEAIGEFAEKAENAAHPVGTTAAAIQELEDALKAAGEEADKLAEDHLTKVLGAAQDMFHEVDTGSRTSMQTLIDTLRKNRESIKAWEDNLSQIKARGASEEFVKYLEGLGLGYADAVDMIATSTDEEFNELLSEWEQNTDEAYEHGKNYGDMMMQGVIDGINAKIAALRAAAENAAKTMHQAFENYLEIKSPSRKGRRAGQNWGEGIVLGAEDELAEIDREGVKTANALAHGFEDVIPSGTLDRALYSSSQALPSQMSADISSLGGKLDALLDAVRAGRVIALDGDKLVGGTIDRINTELGAGLILAERSAI